jgi:hypothetical protein
VRQHALGVHAGLYAVVDVVGDAVEVDDGAQDAVGVVGGLEQPGDQRWFPDPKQGGLLVGVQVGALTRLGAALEGAAPVDELGVDRADRCDQFGDLAGKAAGQTPVADIGLGGCLPAVLDLAASVSSGNAHAHGKKRTRSFGISTTTSSAPRLTQSASASRSTTTPPSGLSQVAANFYKKPAAFAPNRQGVQAGVS